MSGSTATSDRPALTNYWRADNLILYDIPNRAFRRQRDDVFQNEEYEFVGIATDDR